jgi:hypothetical protein
MQRERGRVYMKPVCFPYANAVFAKNQPEYLPLPAWTDSIQVVSGWSLSWRERFYILFTGMLWIRQMTFGLPLQPLRPQALSPFPKMPIIPNDNCDDTQKEKTAPPGSGLKQPGKKDHERND